MSQAMNVMQSPLIVWIQTFSLETVTYQDLVEGIFLNEVLKQIDSRLSFDGLKNNVEDARDKMANWELLLKNIRVFYQDVMACYIVMKPPNIFTICLRPESDSALQEILRALHLLLGCAIHCDAKEELVERMTHLPENVQLSIMGYIQQITNVASTVIAYRLPSEELDEASLQLYNHIKSLLRQRDEYLQEIRSLSWTLNEFEMDSSLMHSIANIDNGLPELINRLTPGGSTSSTSNRNHLVVEIAECKAKMRKLRQELEDRTDTVSELEDEVDNLKQTLQKLKNENLELTRDARAAKGYQDELDIVREKVNRSERLEVEIQRLKEKLKDLEFYRARVEELRQDNSVLLENRNIVEEQLEAAHKRVETVVGLECELKKYKEQRDVLATECDQHRQKVQSLLEENARLEFEKKVHLGQSSSLEEELQKALELTNSDTSNSLYNQMSQAANSQLLRLELENKRLKQDMEEMKENSLLESASKMLALEKENSRLAAKVDKFLESSGQEERRCLDLEHTNQDLIHEKKTLEETIETLRESSERQVKELEKETEQLAQVIKSLRERSEKTNDLRVKDLESENKRLSDALKECTTQVTQLELDQRTLNRKCKQLGDEADRCKMLEEELRKHELANEELRKKVDNLRISCDRQSSLESELSTSESENQKLARTVESLRKTAASKEKLEEENANLTLEMENLKRSLESAKASLVRITELENEKEGMNEQIQRAKEVARVDRLQVERLEQERLSLNADKQYLQKNLEASKEKIRDLQLELETEEIRNAELMRKVEEAKRSCKLQEEVEMRAGQLEFEIDTLRKDRAAGDKENRKLKQSLNEKEAAIDDLTSKVSELEQDHKVLRQLADRNREIEASLCELEKENLGLIQSSSVDKKTIGTLREDLVKEKIRCQQMQTDLENLQRQMKMDNLTLEKSIVSGMSRDEGTFKSLECKMDEAIGNRIRSKEDQIHLMEKQLDEYKSRNSKLQAELNAAKSTSGDNPYGRSSGQERTLVVTQRYSQSPSATQDIINLKDHIIKLERANATLEEENRNVKRQNSDLHDHLQQLQSQNSQWQMQLLAFQTQHNSLQSQLAKVQVENTTVVSENASLTKQNKDLQDECSQADLLLTRLRREHDEFTGTHEALERDLAALQRVHEQLTSEHDALIIKHASLKDVHRGSKADVRHLQERCSELTREKETISQLKKMLEQDKESLRSESQHYETLQTDYIHVREDNLRLLNANDKLSCELVDNQKELRTLKSEIAQLKAKNDELVAANGDYHKQISDRNAEISKMIFRLEETSQWVSKLEEENRALMMQLKLLITQNQDLLTRLLESKDQYVVEQKAYVERLADLRRQKEKLEERIVERYKRYDPAKSKNRSVTANIMKKAKQMIRGKSREQGAPGNDSVLSDSLEGSSSFGSGSAVPSSESLPTPERSEKQAVDQVDGEAGPSAPDQRNQEQQLVKLRHRKMLMMDASQQTAQNKRRSLILLSSSASANRANADRSSREISTNTPSDREDLPITLNEFLQECNRSPKSRRKLLVEKQVALDDNIISLSDITQKPLRPRQPIIADRDLEAALKHFQSEMNVSSPPPEIDRRLCTLPNRNGSAQENRPHNPGSVNRPRVRPLPPSRPASAIEQSFVGQGIDANQVMWCHQSTVMIPQQMSVPCGQPQTGTAFSRYSTAPEECAVPMSGNRRAKPMRSQSLYANERGYYHKPATQAPAAYDDEVQRYQPLNVNFDRRHGGNDMYATPSNDRAYSGHPRSNDPRSKSRGGSVPPEDQQAADYGGDDQRIPPTDSSARHSSGDAGLGSQYNPGNVRHLVHSFQQALKPGGSNCSTPLHSSNARDRSARPGSAAPALSTGNGSSSVPPLHSTFENSMGVCSPTATTSRTLAGTLLRPEDRMDPGYSETRTDTNVCVVRPASGRSLPQPPHSTEQTQLRSESSVGAGSGTTSSRPSSAKAAKPSVYLDYGCL